jgi:hypothetical protein
VGLGHNFLQGQIPSELGQLTLLKTLDLQHTALKGAVPTELGDIETLGMWVSSDAACCHCDSRHCLTPTSINLNNLDNHRYSVSHRTTRSSRDASDGNHAGRNMRSDEAASTKGGTSRLSLKDEMQMLHPMPVEGTIEWPRMVGIFLYALLEYQSRL